MRPGLWGRSSDGGGSRLLWGSLNAGVDGQWSESKPVCGDTVPLGWAPPPVKPKGVAGDVGSGHWFLGDPSSCGPKADGGSLNAPQEGRQRQGEGKVLSTWASL